MKYLKITFTAFLLSLTTIISSQNSELLSKLPETKEQFISSEKNVLATIEWIENTPIDQEKDKHKEQYALLVGWLTNTPTVTLEINANILIFTKKNSELLMFFMAGWTKYSLENNYSNDVLQGNLAGIRSAINIYSKGGLKKDKKMDRLIKLDENDELDKWVSEQLSK